MKIIINNVYAFQYPTKNRCTILVQPSFAKLVLLPIREAYEWKQQGTLGVHKAAVETCFQFVKRMNGNPRGGLRESPAFSGDLLPIREAYEWKQNSYL